MFIHISGWRSIKVDVISQNLIFLVPGCVATNHNVLTLHGRFERVWVVVGPPVTVKPSGKK
jgi:hypothetical protein